MDKAGRYQEVLPDQVGFEMIFVQGGTFLMGSEEFSDAQPHEVSLTEFWIGQNLLTQALWEAVMGKNPAYFQGTNRPIANVTWDDCQAFLRRLNEQTIYTYFLPTEAQWEYAARGGIYAKKHPNWTYVGSNILDEVAWWDENSHDETQYVGQKRPNSLGIFDMSGNLWEWCQDRYSDTYYRECKNSGTISNPTGPKDGESRVVRGGSWDYNFDGYFRVAYRGKNLPTDAYDVIGFRLCRYELTL